MATTKKPTKKQTTKVPEITRWYQRLWFKIASLIGALATVFGLIDNATSIFDKFYHPKPKEISVSDLPIRVKYDKNSGLSVKTRVPYILQTQTYLVDYIDQDSITISDFKIENKSVVNLDSVTSRSLQLYPGAGSSGRGDEIQSLNEVEYNFNVYLTLLPSIANAKSGKVYDLGYAVFSVPYFAKGLRKIKEQKVPIELEVK